MAKATQDTVQQTDCSRSSWSDIYSTKFLKAFTILDCTTRGHSSPDRGKGRGGEGGREREGRGGRKGEGGGGEGSGGDSREVEGGRGRGIEECDGNCWGGE